MACRTLLPRRNEQTSVRCHTPSPGVCLALRAVKRHGFGRCVVAPISAPATAVPCRSGIPKRCSRLAMYCRAIAGAPRCVTRPEMEHLCVPDGATMHRVRSPDGDFDAALVLFAPAETERRCAEARRSKDGRVLEYLRTRRAGALVRTDVAGAALRDAMIDCMVPPAHTTGCIRITQDGRGIRGLLSGCVPVAVLLIARQDTFPDVTDAAWLCLPDGRLAYIPNLYMFEWAATYIVSSGEFTMDETQLDVYRQRAGMFVDVAVVNFWTRDDRSQQPADVLRLMLDRAADAGTAAAAVLAEAVPVAAARSSVFGLVRAHLMLLAARRRAAAAIARAWCRYDGAPRGPRARYLCDLERGWTPDARHGTPTDRERGPRTAAENAPAGDDARAVMGLFASGTAYRTYCDGRLAVLRERLCGVCRGADRVRMRRSSLYELDRRGADAGDGPPAATDPGSAL